MPLTIEGATIGYDQTNIKTLIDNVKVDVVDKAQEELNNKLVDLEEAIDEIWVGRSADIFKNNVKTDISHICDALAKAHEAFTTEMNAITNAMVAMDENLVRERS